MFEVLKDFGVLLPLIILSPQTLQQIVIITDAEVGPNRTLKLSHWTQIDLLISTSFLYRLANYLVQQR